MAVRGRNLEVKAVDPHAAATLAAALALAAEDRGTLVQRDTYFHAVHGRLKLREQPPSVAHLIAYERADGPAPRPSTYRLVEVADHEALASALGDSLGVRVVVEKRRRLLMWRNVRIHLDRVEGLGDFVELEAVASSADGLEGERPRVARVGAALGLEDPRLVRESYGDLLESQRRALGADPAGGRVVRASRRVRR
jgi:adenylate cyclase class IV